MAGFDELMQTAGNVEKIYVMLCMNGPKTTLTGIPLYALLHALKKTELPFEIYLEINEYESSNTLLNTYYPQWQQRNKTFLEEAERVRPGCVQKLDVFQNTPEWKALKKKYENYRQDDRRKTSQDTMLKQDVKKYIALHPRPKEKTEEKYEKEVAEHMIDVTVTLLACHTNPDNPGKKNILITSGSLTNLQSNALQVAQQELELGRLVYHKLSPNGLVDKLQRESPTDYTKCYQEEIQAKLAAAISPAETKAVPAEEQTSVVLHTTDKPSKLMSVSPELSPALLGDPQIPSTALLENSMTTSPVLSDRMITSTTPPPSPPLESGSRHPGSRKKKKLRTALRMVKEDSTAFEERKGIKDKDPVDFDVNEVTYRVALGVFEKKGDDAAIGFIKKIYKQLPPRHSCQHCSNSKILQSLRLSPSKSSTTRKATTESGATSSVAPFASSAFMSSPATTGVQASSSKDTFLPAPTLPPPPSRSFTSASNSVRSLSYSSSSPSSLTGKRPS